MADRAKTGGGGLKKFSALPGNVARRHAEIFSPIKRKSNNQQMTGEKVAAAGARWLLRFAKVFGA
jgi:hypothetical protein